MMNRIGLALVFLVAASATSLGAPTRAEVENLLAGYEPATTLADLRRLGAGVDHVLVVIAADPETSRLRRNRAITALAAVPSVEGRDFLRAVLRQVGRAVEGMDLLDLQASARALRAFGPEALGDLLPLVAHPNADVRRIAVESLAAARAVAAAPSLAVRLRVERDPEVIAALRKAIAALQQK